MTGPIRFVMVVAVALGGAVGQLQAAEEVIVRSSVSPEQAWIGQRVFYEIQVLGADGWAQVPQLPRPELAGAYVVTTESQGVRINETVGGTAYTGQRYRISVYCQRPGRLEIPELPVTVVVKQWGYKAPEISHERVAPPVELVCRVPPGAEDVRGLVSTPRLDADQLWSSSPDTVQLGDALTRTVTRRAVDVSAMAFPPMRHPELEGVGLYPGEPTVTDSSDRGSLLGERVETVTYVFERPGEVALPGLELTWWDTDDEMLRRVELPGLELEVKGELPPRQAAEVEVPQPKTPRRRTLLIAVAVVLLVVSAGLGRWLVRWARHGWQAWQRSEPAAFRRAVTAVRSRDAAAALAAVMEWLDRLDPGPRPARLDLFLERYGDAAARSAGRSLARCLAAGEGFSEGAALERGLTVARRRCMRGRKQRGRAAAVLPELNQPRREAAGSSSLARRELHGVPPT